MIFSCFMCTYRQQIYHIHDTFVVQLQYVTNIIDETSSISLDYFTKFDYLLHMKQCNTCINYFESQDLICILKTKLESYNDKQQNSAFILSDVAYTLQLTEYVEQINDWRIFQLLFVPKSNILLTCFRDDSIFAWDCETLEHLYTLQKQPGEQPAFNSFSTTACGEFLIAGGRLSLFLLCNRHFYPR